MKGWERYLKEKKMEYALFPPPDTKKYRRKENKPRPDTTQYSELQLIVTHIFENEERGYLLGIHAVQSQNPQSLT